MEVIVDQELPSALVRVLMDLIPLLYLSIGAAVAVALYRRWRRNKRKGKR